MRRKVEMYNQQEMKSRLIKSAKYKCGDEVMIDLEKIDEIYQDTFTALRTRANLL